MHREFSDVLFERHLQERRIEQNVLPSHGFTSMSCSRPMPVAMPNSLAVLTNWSTNMLVVVLFPFLNDALGKNVFFFLFTK
ncbi:hypothetical protein niasHT_039910 [Heterodera trifolii]|uniref:Uncharacterized protein n=1 Tax=Heterodera trifolii TaxID=157864 RepID=A0ABD2IFZ5_9BILA